MVRHNKALTFVAWVVLSLVTLVPIYWMFLISGKSRAELFSRPSLLIDSFYTANYTNVISDPAFHRYMINSIVVATSNAVLVTFLAVL
ncbi:MAG: carbohydrate ABC transporter permease, partial [Pseudomonadota bacterium]